MVPVRDAAYDSATPDGREGSEREFQQAAKPPERNQPPAPVNWKIVPDSAQGIVDFGAFTEQSENVSAYALFPVYSLDDRKVAILLGTDDEARLWLNGELLYESLRPRRAVADEDAVSATLKSGWNTLLVRVANEAGDHALYLRFSDAPGDLARIRGREE